MKKVKTVIAIGLLLFALVPIAGAQLNKYWGNIAINKDSTIQRIPNIEKEGLLSEQKEIATVSQKTSAEDPETKDKLMKDTQTITVPKETQTTNKQIIVEANKKEKESTTKKETNTKKKEVAPVPKETNTQDKETNPEKNNTTAKNPHIFEQEVIDLTNKERTKSGLEPLQVNTALSSVARTKSQDMIDKNYFSHTSPTYGSPFDMIKKFGIGYQSAGENIAKGQKTAQEVVNSWMNSEGHRANILNSAYTKIGVGYAVDPNGTVHWTQMFIG